MLNAKYMVEKFAVKQGLGYLRNNPEKNLIPTYTNEIATISISTVEKLKVDKSNAIPP